MRQINHNGIDEVVLVGRSMAGLTMMSNPSLIATIVLDLCSQPVVDQPK